MASENNAILIALTETWLTDRLPDNFLKIPGFHLVRADRSTTHSLFPHGGCLLYVRNGNTVTGTKLYSDGRCDLLIATVGNYDLDIAVLYRPTGNVPKELFGGALETISVYNELTKNNLLMLGDLNFPAKYIEWAALDSGAAATQIGKNESTTLLLDFVDDHSMNQMVTVPTRGKEILDVIFTNSPDLITGVRIQKCNFSDHNVVIAETNLNPPRKQNEKPPPMSEIGRFNFDKADWPLLENTIAGLCLDRSILAATTVEESLDSLLNGLVQACTIAEVPTKLPKKPPQVIPPHRKILFRKIARLNKESKNCECPERISAIKKKVDDANILIKTSIRKEREKEEKKAIDKIKSDSKFFFRFAKGRSKIRDSVGPLKSKDGSLTSDPAKMVGILNDQYCSAHSELVADKIVLDPILFFSGNPDNGPSFCDVEFTAENVEKALSRLKENSAPGEDMLPATLLKHCKGVLAWPLAVYFNKSMSMGVIPMSLKSAIVTPVYKGGPREHAKNYRPIALTSVLSKVMERVITDKLTEYLEENNYMSDRQHGFTIGRSTLSQLIVHYEELVEGLSGGNCNVDIVYTDLSKAFDKADIGSILHALRSLGIGGKLGVWIYSFLYGRTQKVRLDGFESLIAAIKSGVPQGSVLGPILFIILLLTIGDNVMVAKLLSFADDTKLSHTISCEADANDLQTDLNHTYAWAKTVGMSFNGSKFAVVRYGTNMDLQSQTCYSDPDGDIITRVPQMKDLGVIMSDSGLFDDHTKSLIQQCRFTIAQIKRLFTTREREPMMTLFRSLIVSRMDYCSVLYSPQSATLKFELEQIQRSFTKRIDGLSEINYWNRLKMLKIYSVERRHERYLILYCLKVMLGIVPNFGITWHQTSRSGIWVDVPIVPRKDQAKKAYRQLKTQTVSYRAAVAFNSLPATLKVLPNMDLEDPIANFKANLDRFLENIKDEPTVREPGMVRCAASNSIADQMASLRAQF